MIFFDLAEFECDVALIARMTPCESDASDGVSGSTGFGDIGLDHTDHT